jgi:drug/metabolite transporter (DMT)-like permease
MKTARQGQFAGLGAALLFGCSAPLISTLTGTGSALSIAGLLYAGATLALLAVRLVRGTRAETPIRREDWPALAALTSLGGVVSPVALVLGLARLPAASSSLLLNLEAVFTLAIAVLLGREHLGRRGVVSALLTIVGAVVLSQGSLSGANALGGVLIALATLAWGIDNNLSQRLSLRDPIQIATAKAAGACLPMLALALLLGEAFPPLPQSLTVLGIGALGYGLSIWLDLLALRDLGAAREAVLFSIGPFLGALFSVVVLRESLSAPLLLAAGLMGAGGGSQWCQQGCQPCWRSWAPSLITSPKVTSRFRLLRSQRRGRSAAPGGRRSASLPGPSSWSTTCATLSSHDRPGPVLRSFCAQGWGPIPEKSVGATGFEPAT